MTRDELSESVSSRLDHLVTGNPDVKKFFSGIADLSADLFGANSQVSCAVTLMRDELPVTVSFSKPQALAWDEIQHFAGDGPCMQALHTEQVVMTADLRLEPRWPAYSRLISGRGVLAVLGAPLTLPPGSQGVLNFYSPVAGRFGLAEIAAARIYAAQVSAYLIAAMQISGWAARAESAKLTVDSRSVINAAVGIVMGLANSSRETAFTHLLALADSSSQSLRTVSDGIVHSLDL